ncbi:MAG: phosphatase PAP2 family protein [Candidatus Aminicenantes bacterium]|nr:phosphatase PAP2 family protein [Candidatus Aminicenantes bacterium]
MFQTEIIIFLQSFASDFLTGFFKFFTEIGKSTYAAPLVLIVMFGISFRMGFILLHVVSWNGLITFYLKELFSLPRPSNVDFHVKLLGEAARNSTPLESMGAKNFFGGFSRDTLEYIRTYPFDSWGFPSGHASHAVALWGSISLYMKKTWMSVTAVMMIVLIAISRMYLGRHFLADVLGGLLLGFLVTLVFYRGIYKNNSILNFLFEKNEKTRISSGTIIFLFYFLFVPFLVLLIPGIPLKQAGALLGLNLGFIWIRHRGIPKDTGSLLQRSGRVLLAGSVFFLFYAGLKWGIELVFTNEPASVEFIRLVFSMLMSFWGSVEMSIKLGLYKR